jgi:hypothetical protein
MSDLASKTINGARIVAAHLPRPRAGRAEKKKLEETAYVLEPRLLDFSVTLSMALMRSM